MSEEIVKFRRDRNSEKELRSSSSKCGTFPNQHSRGFVNKSEICTTTQKSQNLSSEPNQVDCLQKQNHHHSPEDYTRIQSLGNLRSQHSGFSPKFLSIQRITKM